MIILVIAAIFLTGCAETQTISYEGVPGGRGQGFRLQPYKCLADQAKAKPGVLNGKIVKIVSETFESYMEPGLAMEVNTPNQGLVHVHLGPVWYLERQESDLRPGDLVSIQALCYDVEGKVRLVAAEISHKDHVVQLRDSQGHPYWEAVRPR
jgi:hypothetical protein